MRTKFAAVAVIAASLTAISLANDFTVAGSTRGAFDAQSLGASNTILGLTYDNSTFNDSTVGGFVGFGGNPNPGANFNNFGSMTLSGPGVYTGHTFTLEITFTAPVTITGGNPTTFTAQLLGAVNNAGNGGAQISFSAPNQTFNWANATETGSFTLHMNNVAVNPGQVASVTGYIIGDAQPVPEPATMAVLGLGALTAIRRRRAR